MIPRSEYGGPITKSAEAMFARAQRQAERLDPMARARRAPSRPISPIRQALTQLGLTRATMRNWEDAGLIAFKRSARRRVINAAAIEQMRLVAQLRRAGLSIKAIGRLSDTVPPGLPALRRALQDLSRPDQGQARAILPEHRPAPPASDRRSCQA